MAEEIADQEQLVALLKEAHASIEEALTNLGEDLDDVSGFAQSSHTFRVATTPELATRMGSRFGAGLAMEGDGSCVNIICGGMGMPGSDVINPGF